MKRSDAMRWLDEQGGQWCVRATSASCAVVAILGSMTVKTPFANLHAEDIGNALVAAVTRLQQLSMQ